MPQFTVHRNRNPATRGRAPLLLDVQAGLLAGLGTRVVIPLIPASADARRGALQTLTPLVSVEGRDYLLMAPQLAGIASRELGAEVADLSSARDAIVAALDFLITGI
jgi:toxin CcdB